MELQNRGVWWSVLIFLMLLVAFVGLVIPGAVAGWRWTKNILTPGPSHAAPAAAARAGTMIPDDHEGYIFVSPAGSPYTLTIRPGEPTEWIKIAGGAHMVVKPPGKNFYDFELGDGSLKVIEDHRDNKERIRWPSTLFRIRGDPGKATIYLN